MGLTAPELLAALRSRGVGLETDGRRLRWRPVTLVDADTATAIVSLKAELIALVLPKSCPGCGRQTDEKRRCWKCNDRRCEGCGRPTGSAFIANCIRCGALIPDGGDPYGG